MVKCIVTIRDGTTKASLLPVTVREGQFGKSLIVDVDGVKMDIPLEELADDLKKLLRK